MPSLSTGQKSLDVLKINNAEPLVGLIDDATKDIPEMGFFDASPITRNEFKTLALVKDPKVGFRKPGAFADHESAVLQLRTCACAFLDASWKADTALAEQSDWGKEKFFAIETLSHLRAAFMMLARQIWYGAHSTSDGFQGLYELIGKVEDGHLLSNADLHIDVKEFLGDKANKTAKANAGLSSVFAVSTGLDSIQLAWGSEGKLTEGDVTKIHIANPESKEKAKNSVAWWYGQEISGWCGLQVTSAHAFGRIHNLSDVNPLNDTMLFELLRRFPVGREPKAFFMSRRSLEQLRRSRLPYHPTGMPVANPDNVAGIPIITTDAILCNEETILTAAP